MNLKRGVVLGAATSITLALLSTPALAGNLLTNGSFENATNLAPDSTLNPGATNLTGWTVIGGGNLLWCDPAYCGVPPSNGDYSLDLTGLTNAPPYAGVSQSINTTLGAHYELSFDLNGRADSLPVAIQATAGASSQTFTNSAGGWTTEMLSFTGTGGPTTISLLGTLAGGDGLDLQLDNAIVTGPGGVPEPESWVMMLLGFGGAGLTLRRRKLTPRAARTLP